MYLFQERYKVLLFFVKAALSDSEFYNITSDDKYLL